MSVFDLFSKRSKRVRGEFPDVYHYEEIPHQLRVQVVHIWMSAFGPVEDFTYANDVFRKIQGTICREYGLFDLPGGNASVLEKVANFMLNASDIEEVLDIIELTFKAIDTIVRQSGFGTFGSQRPDDAIEELNTRFREHGVGYQFISGQIIRVDSQLVHAEIVKPTLQFLSGNDFKGANQEFLSAHQHYREGKFKECLNDCLKALESTMKSICNKKGWSYRPNDTAKALLDILFQNGLIPQFLQNHFGALRASLESGVPTVRNKLGGHGQGVQQVNVPDYLASYTLHLTATSILFLVDASNKHK